MPDCWPLKSLYLFSLSPKCCLPFPCLQQHPWGSYEEKTAFINISSLSLSSVRLLPLCLFPAEGASSTPHPPPESKGCKFVKGSLYNPTKTLQDSFKSHRLVKIDKKIIYTYMHTSMHTHTYLIPEPSPVSRTPVHSPLLYQHTCPAPASFVEDAGVGSVFPFIPLLPLP